MSDDFASPSNIRWSGHVGTVEYGGGDRSMVVMFFKKAFHNPAASKAAGRPVYEDKTYVRVHPPGERLNIVERPARDDDAARWPAQWAQFSKNQEQIPDGTPIDLLYPETPAIAMAMRAAGVHTIEQCADLSAHAIESVGMGAQRYVNDAKKFIEMANKGVGASQFRQAMSEKDQELRVLHQQLEALKAEVQALRKQQIGIDPAQLQTLIAGAMTRPGMPTNPVSPNFDASLAQINATHGSQTTPPTRQKIKRVKL